MSTPPVGRRPGLAATIWLYALARLAVVALVAGLLALAGVPLLIAVLVGLIVALPLSMVLFRGLRGRLDHTLATARERRSAERAALRSRLRGDAPVGPDPDPKDPGSPALDPGSPAPDPGSPTAGQATAGAAAVGPAAPDPDLPASDQRPADQQPQRQPDRGER